MLLGRLLLTVDLCLFVVMLPWRSVTWEYSSGLLWDNWPQFSVLGLNGEGSSACVAIPECLHTQ